MHRLSGTDTNHLRMETPEQPMTACGMFMLDTSTMPSGYSFEAFRDKLSGQIAALPEFRMKLADSALNLDNPVWVDDPSFELDHHLHRVELPAPGGPRELSELAARLVAERMDRDRPVWDMWVVEGLVDADPGLKANVAVILRMQHVLADGPTALNIFSRLCSTQSDPAPPAPYCRGRDCEQAADRAGWVGPVCLQALVSDQDAVVGVGRRPIQRQKAPSVCWGQNRAGLVRPNAKCAANSVQWQHHESPHRGVRPAESNGCQGRQGQVRRYRQRCDVGCGVRCAQTISARPHRLAPSRTPRDDARRGYLTRPA